MNYQKPDIEETNVGAHAILVDSNHRIILYKRDNNPNIINPGKIAMFGGSLNKDESIENGLAREIREELNLQLNRESLTKLNTYIKTKEIDGVDYTAHIFVVKNVKIENLELHEGVSFVHDFPEILVNNPNLTRITKLALQDYLLHFG